METQAVVFVEPGEPELLSIAVPDLRPDEVRVRTLCSGISIGTERLLWEGRLRSAQFPMVIGNQATAIIEAVGSEVQDICPGQKVVIRAMRLDGDIAAVNGAHCSGGVVPRSEVTPVPAELDAAAGSLFVLPCVGFWGVTKAGVELDDLVVIQGAGMVGLGVLTAAKLRGARVMVTDINRRRLDLALKMGADTVVDATREDPVREVRKLQADGADLVFESTGIAELLDHALAMARPGGKFVFQGHYGDDRPVNFAYVVPHTKQLTCYFPCNDGLQPCRREVTKLMARGAIDWGQVITHIVTPAEAADAYRMVIEDIDDPIGVVIQWSE